MTDKIERGLQAESLLSSELFNELLTELEASYIGTWKIANTVEAREDLHRYMVLIAQFKTDLQSVANTGRLTAVRRATLEGGPISIHHPLRRA